MEKCSRYNPNRNKGVNLERQKDIKSLRVLFTDLKRPTIDKPELPEKSTKAEESLYVEECKQYIKDARSLEGALTSLYNVTWGQCSTMFQNKLRADKSFDDYHADSDVVSLLKQIKYLSNKIDENSSIYDALHEAKARLYTYRQQDDETVAEHLDNFKDLINSIEYYGGNPFYDKMMVQYEQRWDREKGIDPVSDTEYKQRVEDKSAAMAFLKSANVKKYGKLISCIREQHAFKMDVYPKTLVDAYELLSTHVVQKTKSDGTTSSNKKQTRSISTNDTSESNQEVGTMYLQADDTVPGSDGQLAPHITCFKCNKKGHYSDNCPSETEQQHVQTNTTDTNNGEETDRYDQTDDYGERQHLQVDADSDDDSVVIHFSWAQLARYERAAKDYGDTSILIDTGSTFSVFNNPKMLLNIRSSKRTLKAYTNGGRQDSNLIGDLPGFFPVWYNPKSMINILAWSDVCDKYRITADTEVGKYITVHVSKQFKMIFEQVSSGLYLFSHKQQYKHRISGYSFLTLTTGDKSKFNKREIEQAEAARTLHRAIGFPGYKRFFWMIKNNKIPKCQITVDDAKRALHLYGPDEAVIKGKTTKKRQSVIKNVEVIPLADSILTKHKSVHLMVDHMFIQGLLCLVTISQGYNFRTVEPLMTKAKANKEDMIAGVNRVIGLYRARGLNVTQVSADNEFECIRDDLLPVFLNIVAADEHVSNIERSIRTVKERTRCHIHHLPYARYPKLLVAGCVITAVKGLNNEVGISPLSEEYSPFTLVTGQQIPTHEQAIGLTFGDYVQVHNIQEMNNTTHSRTLPAIALYPSGNLQNGWRFLSLDTGKMIHRKHWSKLPITQRVINRVNELGNDEGRPLVSTNFKYYWGDESDDYSEEDSDSNDGNHSEPTIQFNDISDDVNDILEISEGNQEAINEDHDDCNDDPLEDQRSVPEQEDERSAPDHIRSNDEIQEHAEYEQDTPEDDRMDDQSARDQIDDAVDTECEEDYHVVGTHNDATHNDEGDAVNTRSDELNDDELEVGSANTNEMEESANDSMAERRHDYNLRETERVNYKTFHNLGEKQLLQVQCSWIQDLIQQSNVDGSQKNAARKLCLKGSDMFRKAVGITLTQMSKVDKYAQVSVREGIKRHGQKAIDAMMKEFAQLNDKGTFVPVDVSKLSKKDKMEALNLITMIKQKRCGKIKGRACADGRKQRRYIKKEDVASPTVQLNSLLLSLVIDALEHRDVATADVVGAYLMAMLNDFILVKLTGESVNIMCEVNPALRKYVTKEKKGKVLYLKLAKALYGCMQSALLWYETFRDCLEGMGFKLNPYDPCVANQIIDGKQCTVCWYVDDTKISHEDPKVVDKVIQQIEAKFGKMTVTRGKRHTFVGMDIEFQADGTVALSMEEYIKECVSLYEPQLKTYKTPAAGTLFDDDTPEKAEELSEKDADLFHHATAKLLFAAKRARIDIDLAVSFLCTRVAKPTLGDREKLLRTMGYLKGTTGLKRIMGMNDTHMYTWVDTSYGIHRDLKGHNGGTVSLGHGVTLHGCSKQKINTKSSTESEIVGASDFLPTTIWAKYFLEAQGYKVARNVFFQDNMSAIKMLKNGRASTSSKSRHIHIRYFFTKDILERNDIEVQYCATNQMIADYYTKPLQGKQFYTLRDLIMGAKPMEVNNTTKERVVESPKMIPKRAKRKSKNVVCVDNMRSKPYKVSNNFT